MASPADPGIRLWLAASVFGTAYGPAAAGIGAEGGGVVDFHSACIVRCAGCEYSELLGSDKADDTFAGGCNPDKHSDYFYGVRQGVPVVGRKELQ